MYKGLIRPIAICIIFNDDKIFVFEGEDKHKPETFYRPLGGAIDFGERGEDAIKREFREEINAELTNLKYLGTLENIFTYCGREHHEIVLVFQGDFANRELYAQSEMTGHEDDGSVLKCLWKPLEDFRDSDAPLYPEGLLKLIDESERKNR
jgi:8-oxo-dGTP pyrophosphatase MutT (NUDIX family)